MMFEKIIDALLNFLCFCLIIIAIMLIVFIADPDFFSALMGLLF